MQLRYYRGEMASTPVLSVDGICPTGPNLSHWPGNRTPAAWKHDLSTGICLRFAALPKREREEFLEGVEVVSNNHYDTDGLLSLWVALNPEKALRFAPRLLHAAEAGDFSHAPTPEAVKLDLVVTAFADPKVSPIGLELWNLSAEDRHERAYQVLLGMLPRLLDRLDDYRGLWKDPFLRFEESHGYIRREGAVRRYADLDLAVIEADRSLDERALQTSAETDRVLFVQHTPEGNLYRFWYAATSWFDLVTIRKPPRIPPSQLAKALNRECPGDGGRWIGEAADQPISNLFYGEPREKAKYLDLPGNLLPHPVVAARLEETLVRLLRSGGSPR